MITSMVDHETALDSIFRAVADPTRRAILKQLGPTPARVTDIAQKFPVSLNAISKHLMVLERAGLIQRDVHGRDHICRLDGQPLRQAVAWMEGIRAFWETRLDALERHVLERRRKSK